MSKASKIEGAGFWTATVIGDIHKGEYRRAAMSLASQFEEFCDAGPTRRERMAPGLFAVTFAMETSTPFPSKAHLLLLAVRGYLREILAGASLDRDMITNSTWDLALSVK